MFKVVKYAVTPLVPAFLVIAAGVRAEQHPTRFQCRAQFQQHARQLLARYMKQRGVGEYAVEPLIRQIDLEEVLVPHFAAAVETRHRGEAGGAVQTHRAVTEVGKGLEIAAWSATKIEYRERWLALDILQQGRNILADVVVASAFLEIIGAAIVLLKGEVNDSFEFRLV